MATSSLCEEIIGLTWEGTYRRMLQRIISDYVVLAYGKKDSNVKLYGQEDISITPFNSLFERLNHFSEIFERLKKEDIRPLLAIREGISDLYGDEYKSKLLRGLLEDCYKKILETSLENLLKK